ncbi:MAG: hypothetical protein JWP44_561 [Mucilaginibacter sp.]|nr:hypothetical protein [Mucilaginibacter sp.]
MHEEVLRDYFDNKIPTDVLYMDVDSSEIKTSNDVITINVNQIVNGSEYRIDRNHLIKLCNDAIIGSIKSSHLTTIAYALICSEFFTWNEDDIIATVIFDWDNPEISFPLTINNLEKWRSYLISGKYNLK